MTQGNPFNMGMAQMPQWAAQYDWRWFVQPYAGQGNPFAPLMVYDPFLAANLTAVNPFAQPSVPPSQPVQIGASPNSTPVWGAIDENAIIKEQRKAEKRAVQGAVVGAATNWIGNRLIASGNPLGVALGLGLRLFGGLFGGRGK